jgi:hypothetical protein
VRELMALNRIKRASARSDTSRPRPPGAVNALVEYDAAQTILT